MKRVISILLAAAMLMTLTCISAFAAPTVTIDFDCPSAGDEIPDPYSSTAVNSGPLEAILFCRIAGQEAINAFLSNKPQDMETLSAYETAHPFSDTNYRQNVPYLFAYYISGVSSGDIAAGSNVTATLLFADDDGVCVYLSFTPVGGDTGNGNTGDSNASVPGNGTDNTIGNTPSNGNNSTITSQNGTTEIPITASYDTTLVEQKVYRVDIVWGSMAFTYHPEFVGTWNPNTHTYSDEAEAYWSFEENANRIIVTNHSNAPISATFSYAAFNGYDGITGVFSTGSQSISGPQTIASASKTLFNEAPFLAAYLMLNGDLNKETANSTQIGTFTVSIS